jgi:hypothetical protein
MGVLQATSKEAVCHGKTVGPEDRDKVLFRWRLDDGGYRVIFGDLTARTVSAEKLKELEAKGGGRGRDERKRPGHSCRGAGEPGLEIPQGDSNPCLILYAARIGTSSKR